MHMFIVFKHHNFIKVKVKVTLRTGHEGPEGE